jgi:predicted dehydrogenase
MSVKDPVRFAVVGPGGFGREHRRAIQALADEGEAALAAVVSRPGENAEIVPQLQAQGVPIYPSLDALLAGGEAVDVVTVPTSIYSHAALTIRALEGGRHVYCEKPAAATVQEVDAMIAARERAGRLCAVGFQEMASPALQRIKEALCAGRIGRLRTLKAHVLWPRWDSYYARNEWAGKLRIGDAWVLDGPANNAASHTLNALLYLAGTERFAPARPARVTAELYRANAIETYDTAAIRVHTDDDVEILFYVTHAGERNEAPYIEVAGDRGTLRRWGEEGHTELRADGARPETWSAAGIDVRLIGFRHFCRAVRSEEQLLLPVENARAHTLVIDAAHDSSPIHAFPPTICERGDSDRGPRTLVPGLDAIIRQAFAEGKLLSESGASWGVPGREVDTRGYTRFPSGPS